MTGGGEQGMLPERVIASGKKISLVRASLVDRPRLYKWFVRAWAAPDGVVSRRGSMPPPAFEAFCAYWQPHYFDGTRPYDGRAFLIRDGAKEVGFISHGPIDIYRDVTELNVWLASEEVWGNGYASDALGTICPWLQAQYGVNRFLVRPSKSNVHALRAMRRAGFRQTDMSADELTTNLALAEGLYADAVLMFSVLEQPAASLEMDHDHTYVFFDSEFTNFTNPSLISIGAVATDSTAFYCELSDFPSAQCSAFVRETVLPLLDGDCVPRTIAAQSFVRWLAARSAAAPVMLVSDSGFDRWAVAHLFNYEELPEHVEWMRVPVSYEDLDKTARARGLRRHHALDDARALRYWLTNIS